MLLPGTSVRMKIGRPASMRLVEEYVAPQFAAGHKGAQAIVGVVAVVHELHDGREPGPDDLNPFGCVGRVFRCEKVVEDGETRYILVIEGADQSKRVPRARRSIASPSLFCPRLTPGVGSRPHPLPHSQVYPTRAIPEGPGGKAA